MKIYFKHIPIATTFTFRGNDAQKSSKRTVNVYLNGFDPTKPYEKVWVDYDEVCEIMDEAAEFIKLGAFALPPSVPVGQRYTEVEPADAVMASERARLRREENMAARKLERERAKEEARLAKRREYDKRRKQRLTLKPSHHNILRRALTHEHFTRILERGVTFGLTESELKTLRDAINQL
jgi:hypothetical protein